jgi:hypothetical protein
MAKPFIDVHLSVWFLTGLEQRAGREQRFSASSR